MARDKITVELELATRRAEREVAGLQKKIDALGKGVGRAFGAGGGGGDKTRALGTGLSKATVKADEFNKSLEASNARVIAFGASAGLIMQVDRALKGMVASAIKVEKAMADVNVVMNVSVKTLDQFGKGMFKVAKETAQSFDTVSEAAVELARQGLGMEKTLARTKDALILTRLTGMNAADSVKTLTAAVNSFNKEGVTSAQVINRMAKVDAAFAVSSEDLAKSISRVGSSAIDAGVNLNQLMAITTAVQQKTARGGAVIGNAFKTIFTRIQRSDVQKKLKDIGVALTKDGKLLDGVTILQNLSRSFDTLSKAQQASVGESVAGVFQINILKAAMSDLVNVNSEYAKSLKIANAATNEAYVRNEQLNQTLDALANKTLANLTAAGASLGGGLFEPVIRKVLGTVNTAIDSFGKDGKMEGFGQTIGKGLMGGIANFISGPGLVMAIAVFGKLAISLAKFASTALQDVMGINNATKQRLALEEAVVGLLQSEPMYLEAVEKGTLDVLKVEQMIFNQIKANNLERSKLAAYAAPITGALIGRGTSVSKKGAVVTKGGPGGAGGFIPNFASPGGERAAAAAGGYTAGGIRTMNQPGAGTVMYNTAETVKRFPGMSQSAIMPPEGSPAGAGYKGAFGSAHGFDPYAGGGFVPNFVGKMGPLKKGGAFASATNIGVALGFQGKKGDVGGIYSQKASEITALRANLHPDALNAKVGLTGVKTRAIYQPGRNEDDAKALFEGEMEKAIRGSLGLVAGSIIKQLDVDGKPIGAKALAKVATDVETKPLKLAPSFEGDLFEEGLRIAIQGSDVTSTKAAFDFEAGAPPSELMKKLFGTMPENSRIDAKRQQSTADNIVNKYFSEGIIATGKGARKFPSAALMVEELDSGIREGQISGKPIGRFIHTAFRQNVAGMAKGKIQKSAAGGFVPNFSPLTSAIGREVQAGVPSSAIRVGSSTALRGAGNPGGVGVYNTIHEPGGLGQGISRSRAGGIDPRTHGAASGFVPNFEYKTMKSGWAPKGFEGFTREVADKKGFSFDRKGAKEWKAGTKKIGVAGDKIFMAAMVLNMAASGISTGVGASPKVQSGVNALSNIGMMTAMGAMMVPAMPLAGAAGGAALGALSSIGDIGELMGVNDQTRAREQMEQTANAVSASLDLMTIAMQNLKDESTPAETRVQSIANIVKGFNEVMAETKDIKNDPIVDDIRTKLQETVDPRALVQSGGGSFSDKELNNMSVNIQRRKEEMKAVAASEATPFAPYLRGEGSEIRNPSVIDDVMVQKGGELAEQIFGSGLQARMVNSQIGRSTAGGTEYISGKQELQDIGAMVKEARAAQAKAMAQPLTDERGNVISNEWVSKATDEAGAESRKETLEDAELRRRKATLAAGRPKMDEAALRLSGVMAAGGGDVYARELSRATQDGAFDKKGNYTERTPGQEARLSRFMLGAFGQRGVGGLGDFKQGTSYGVPGLMAPGQYLEPEVISGQQSVTQPGEMRRKYRTSRGKLSRDLLRGRYGRGPTAVDQGDLTDMGNIKRNAAGRVAARQNRSRMMSLTMGGDQLIESQGGVQVEGSRAKAQAAKRTLRINQRLKLEEEEIKLKDGLVKGLQAVSDMPLDQQKVQLERITKDYAKIGDLSTSEVKKKIEDLEKQEFADIQLSSLQEAELKFLTGFLRAKEKNGKETLHLESEANANRDAEIDVIEDGIDARKKERRAMLSFQKDIRIQAIRDQTFKTGEEARGLRVLRDKGFGITEREIADADKAARRAGIREGTRGGATFGEIFGETNAYGKTDHMLEFEDGMTSVAENMKSSFADAFKSISSGASSGKEALKAFADSILNSISDISAKMATNMLFSSMGGKAQGGYIPRFQSGGVVSGGSGFKDDVPALMSGGEYVIKKSSAQKIGYGTLNAINGGGNSRGGSIPHFQYGGFNTTSSGAPRGGGSTAGAGGAGSAGGAGFTGMDMAKMYGVSAAASMASGYLNRPDKTEKQTSRNYGLGRDEYGYFGGADPDAGGGDAISGGGRRAGVSLNKAFAYYRRDPVTGQLISERARPTEGRFETSSLLSTRGLLREDDPQTARMFSKEGKMADYQQTRAEWKKNKEDTLTAHYKAQNARTIGAWVNAAMIIGVGAYSGGFGGGSGGGGSSWSPKGAGDFGGPGIARGGSIPKFAEGGSVSPAMLMGGEYVMSPEAVRTHGVNFMSELNRGNVPGGAGGGFFSGGGGGGAAMSGSAPTTNNVKININIDKSGKSEVGASTETFADGGKDERDTNNEAQDNKAMAELLQGVVLSEITKQQRPGGLLQNARP